MAALTEQLRHGAEHAWASLSDGWHELRARGNGALTRFRLDGSRGKGAAAVAEGPGSVAWGLMAADVRVEDDRVVVRVEAPGMTREDLHIEVDRDRLSVTGEKRFDHEAVDGNYRLVQCAYGSFRRDVPLPMPVDAGHAKASYLDGVLRVEMPRLERGRPRRIVVRGA